MSPQAHKQTTLFHHLWHWTERASKLYRNKASNDDVNNVYKGLLDINPEGKIQREIKDIKEELDIMIQFHRKQHEIARRFARNVQQVLDLKRADGMPVMLDALQMAQQGDQDVQQIQQIFTGGSDSKELTPEDKKQRRKLNWFNTLATELSGDMSERTQELQGLKDYAESTGQSVRVFGQAGYSGRAFVSVLVDANACQRSPTCSVSSSNRPA